MVTAEFVMILDTMIAVFQLIESPGAPFGVYRLRISYSGLGEHSSRTMDFGNHAPEGARRPAMPGNGYGCGCIRPGCPAGSERP